MTVIDLGELRSDAERDPPPPPRAVGRPLRVALAGAAALLALAGSAPVASPASALVTGPPGTEAVAAGGRVYVAGPVSSGEGGTREVTAHAPPARAGGALRPLWRASVQIGAGPLQVWEHVGLVLVTGGDDRLLATVALDAATGRQRWRLPGASAPTVGGGLLLFGYGTVDPLRGVDAASGRPRWSVAAHWSWTVRQRGVEIDRIVLLGRSGRIEVREAASGAVLAARDTGRSPGVQTARVAGGLLLLATGGETGLDRVTAYGLDALDRRWELDLPRTGDLPDCGDLLCVATPEAGLAVFDPATRRPRWTNPRWTGVVAARGGRLLVADIEDVTSSAASEVAVLDAATGRTVAALGSWRPVDQWDPDGPLFGTRPTREGGLIVAELDPARATARWLDVLPDVTGRCRAVDRDLLCPVRNGAQGWWRLPR
ncbi:outer membrane protein assembly factor BamB family protein [Micromonospora okii]|uniref:outer membrane protein assembly factor BamB family protein n=1 Tax=Micromonospora okii TaxID=1182970 RepID=UPI001E387330|nr:PQQ-binding-like beta-propeller repeat protein [Micromonospora okii]